MSVRHPITRKVCLWCKEPFSGGPKAIYCTESCAGFHRRQKRGAKTNAHWGATEESRRAMLPYRERGLTYGQAVRAWLADYKVKQGCADCGYNAHFSALQLDHEGKKSVEIALARTSIDRLLAEIRNGECVVRCANCHSIKTWERKQA